MYPYVVCKLLFYGQDVDLVYVMNEISLEFPFTFCHALDFETRSRTHFSFHISSSCWCWCWRSSWMFLSLVWVIEAQCGQIIHPPRRLPGSRCPLHSRVTRVTPHAWPGHVARYVAPWRISWELGGAAPEAELGRSPAHIRYTQSWIFLELGIGIHNLDIRVYQKGAMTFFWVYWTFANQTLNQIVSS